MRVKLLIAALSVAIMPTIAPAAMADACVAQEAVGGGFTTPHIQETLYQPDVIKADLDNWLKQSMATHPNFDMAIDLDELYRVRAEIKRQIDRTMNDIEIFRLFSQLNSVLADGHHGIAFAGRNSKIEQAVEAGDRLLPLYIHIDDDYRVYVKKAHEGLSAGTEIVAINGVKASDMAHVLEGRSHGDTPKFRRHLVADRFPELIWQHYGSARNFELVVKTEEGCETVTVAGTTKVMPHRLNNPPFEPRVQFKLMDNDRVGYLKVDSFFLPEDMDRWYALTSQAFAEMKAKGTRHLIVDVRRNGGGDDALWIEGILPYVAGKPWQRMANFLGRVRDTDEAFPGRVGDVAVFDYQGEMLVSDKRSFDGDVYVITGPLTYSSAIMFSTVMQDNGLAKIVGETTAARSCSTGMSGYHSMAVGGVITFTPIHWYQRNNPTQSCMEGVHPDIEMVDDNPFDEMAMVRRLIKRISKD